MNNTREQVIAGLETLKGSLATAETLEPGVKRICEAYYELASSLGADFLTLDQALKDANALYGAQADENDRTCKRLMEALAGLMSPGEPMNEDGECGYCGEPFDGDGEACDHLSTCHWRIAGKILASRNHK